MSEKNSTYGQTLPDLGTQVRKWRLAKKMTQADLEEGAGLSHNAVSRIECGNVSPKIETLDRISKSLDISIEQLQFQTPPTMVAENQRDYVADSQIQKLIAALGKIPEPKRGDLLSTFLRLVKIAAGESDE